MVSLGTAPHDGGLVLLLCCLANRILSGMAEGMASGAAYDLIFMTRVASLVGVDFHFTQDWTLRFPIYLTLVNGIAAFILSIGLREPVRSAFSSRSAALITESSNCRRRASESSPQSSAGWAS